MNRRISLFLPILIVILVFAYFPIHIVPFVDASASNTFKVTTSTDDVARRITPSYISLTAEFFAGRYSGSTIYKYGAGARFNSVNIPKGATITSAYLNLTARVSFTISAGYQRAKLRGQTADNATTFSTAADFDARTFTTNYTDYANGEVWAWTKDQIYKSPDFSSVIYEITSRSGWASGNSLVIFWDDFDARTTADNCVPDAYQYDENSTGCPTLYVSWTPANPTVSSLGVDSTENNHADTMFGYWTAPNPNTLSFYIFGCNITGSWVNDTTTAFTGSPSVAWVNVTKTPSLSVGFVVQWEEWVNDSFNTWGNSGLQSWTVTATITFCFTNFGTVERNGTTIANSTTTTYSIQTNLTMSALPTANYTLLIWNTSYTSSTSNPYTFVVVNLTTLWCYFWDSGTWNYSTGYSAGYTVGWNAGNATGYSAGYSNGWNDGNSTGYTNGWNAGNASGYTLGWTVGNASGYATGWTVGYVSGYAIGYVDGLGNNTVAIARFEFTPSNPSNTTSVLFNASQSFASLSITSYEWNFGDGNTTSTGSSLISHTYSVDGVYLVLLNVSSSASHVSGFTFSSITIGASGGGTTVFGVEFLLFGFLLFAIAIVLAVALNKN